MFGEQGLHWLVLAQAEANSEAATIEPPKAPKPSPEPPPTLTSMLPALAIIMAMFYFIMIRPQRAKDQQFRSMLSNLKEKDHVVTIGGIHGVVTNVQRDNDTVTLRIDDSTGTKIRVNTSAIARVATDDDKSDKPSS